jgi:hypothetical protein
MIETTIDPPSKKELKLKKREEKYQRLIEKRREGRKEEKQLMKERKRERNQALIAQGSFFIHSPLGLPPITRTRISTMNPVDMNFVVDLDFNDKMNRKVGNRNAF